MLQVVLQTATLNGGGKQVEVIVTQAPIVPESPTRVAAETLGIE
jgi:hypothetical protein